MRWRFTRQLAVLAGLALVFAVLNGPQAPHDGPFAVPASHAATISVDTNADTGAAVGCPPNPCELRRAIAVANPDDTINFTGLVTPAIITLNPALGELIIDKKLTIQGPGASNLTITANNALIRVFQIAPPGATDEVTIRALTITGGNPAAFGGGVAITNGEASFNNLVVTGNTSTGNGGGIYTEGKLTVRNSTISGNTAPSGGGLNLAPPGGFVARVVDSTVSGNTATGAAGAAGILVSGGITLELLRSTVNNNTATGANAPAGGIYNNGGTVQLTNATVSSNSANGGGGGLFQASGATTVVHSTIAYNTAGVNLGGSLDNGGGTIHVGHSIMAYPTMTVRNCLGAITSLGNNFEFDGNSCNLVGPGDRLADPQLEPLALNQPLPTGTPVNVQTHALGPGSPALDAVTATPLVTPTVFEGCTANDQRLVSRPQTINASRCDPGAYERQPVPATTLTVDTLDDLAGAGCPVGSCSLRKALAAANPGDIIQFSVNGIINLSMGELVVDRRLTINGPGASQLTVSANNASRVFNVSPANTADGVTIKNLTVRDGTANLGGGLQLLGGEVTLDGLTVRNNTGTAGAGGIHVETQLTLRNSTLTSNTGTSGAAWSFEKRSRPRLRTAPSARTTLLVAVAAE